VACQAGGLEKRCLLYQLSRPCLEIPVSLDPRERDETRLLKTLKRLKLGRGTSAFRSGLMIGQIEAAVARRMVVSCQSLSVVAKLEAMHHGDPRTPRPVLLGGGLERYTTREEMTLSTSVMYRRSNDGRISRCARPLVR
jgi:hypothetical protein